MANLPPLTWLRAFEAAARHLSFTQAAAELHLTQSAVSQHVRNLESALGMALFVRKTRALQLTEGGASYLPVVQNAFAVLSAGTRSLTGDRGRQLRVRCNLAFATFWLAPRLGALLSAHPWLSLTLTTPIWDPEHAEGLAAVEIRFGRPGLMPDDARRLAHERAYPVCACDAEPMFRDWKTAPLHDCTGVATTWHEWLTSQGEQLPSDRVVNLASTYVVAMTAALHGAGLSMAHDTLASGLIAENRLVRPHDHWVEMVEGYFLIAPARHEETPAARAFVDWIRNEVPSPSA